MVSELVPGWSGGSDSEGRRLGVTRPKVIYLDQNMWISLGRAYHQHRRGLRYSSILERVQCAVDTGGAILPLSDAHVIETRKTGDLSRRKRLAHVMIEISQGWTLAPSSYVVPRELEIALARLLGQDEVDPPTALGRGVAFAFGQSETLPVELGISKERAQVLERVMDSPEGLGRFLVGTNEGLNIRGVTEFRRRANLFAERVETARARGKGYSKSVRKRAYVAELTSYLEPELTRLLSRYGKSFEDFLSLGRNRLMAFFEQIPSLNVEIELATERDEHRDREIDPNDMVDVSFLSVAIPYCDIVATERFWTHLAKRRKLDQKYHTVVLDDLFGLKEYLDVSEAVF